MFCFATVVLIVLFFFDMMPPDFKQDPYSEGNPANAICSRGDLAQKPYPGGCIDTKVRPSFTCMGETSGWLLHFQVEPMELT